MDDLFTPDTNNDEEFSLLADSMPEPEVPQKNEPDPVCEPSQQPAAPVYSAPDYSAPDYSAGEPSEPPPPSAAAPPVNPPPAPGYGGYYAASQPNQPTPPPVYPPPFINQNPPQGYYHTQQNRPVQSYSPPRSYSPPAYFPGGYAQPNIPQKAQDLEDPFVRGRVTSQKNNKAAKVLIAIVLVFVLVGTGCLGYFIIDQRSNGGSEIISSSEESPGGSSDSEIDLPLNENSDGGNPGNFPGGQYSTVEVAERVRPCVVGVLAYSRESIDSTSSGSGIILTEDGYVVTNAHVVNNGTNPRLKVVLYDQTEYEAELVGLDTRTDLAVLKVLDADNLKAAELGNSDNVKVGEYVLAIGNPGGLELHSSITGGLISAVDRSITTSGGPSMVCIQTDAAINPGNSGGALVNMSGHVIGINSAKIVAEGYEGIGFAIPSSTAKPIIEQLISHGKVPDRAFLGITYEPIDAYESEWFNLPIGLRITTIYPQSDLINTDAKAGDVIVKVDGKDVKQATDLLDVINSKKPGDTIELTLYRPGKGVGSHVDVTVKLIEEIPDDDPISDPYPDE